MDEKMLNLETFASGALSEQINSELKKVIHNIYDPNTDAQKTRKLNVTITMKPSKDRGMVATSVQTKSTLSPFIPCETNIIIGRDIKTGEIFASEYKNQLAGQMQIDPETGEIKTEGIKDLRLVSK